MLLDVFKKSSSFTPYINTGTMFDLATGQYRPGTKGMWVLDGGLSQCLGISGRGQTYKSGIAGSLLANAMLVHPEAQAFIYETEGTISSEERYSDFVPRNSPVHDRITFVTSTDLTLTDFYDKFMELCDLKIKNKKDFIVESPFLDPSTGKPYKVWIPTFVLVDSFSRARTGKGEQKFEENSVDDTSLNTLFLQEGGQKTKIMTDLPTRATKAGVYCILTAHVGEKYVLDPYAGGAIKQLQYMKNSDKMKNVGSNFEFLTTTLIQTLKATVMQNKDKGCLYPTKFSTDVEVNQVDTMLVRCKNNASGLMTPYVVSQYQGILSAVTNFHFLQKNKNFGMNVRGNNQGFSTLITPDKELTKKNVRELTDSDYGVARALEIITQLCFVQTLWSTWKLPEYVSMSPEVLVEKLKNSKKCSIDRVLQSTGVWSTSKQDRERLTLMDILQFLDSEK